MGGAPKFREESILLASDREIPFLPGWSQHAVLCKTPNANQTHVRVFLKGLCPTSRLEEEYLLNWYPLSTNPWGEVMFWYQGYKNATIRYIGKDTWVIADNENWMWNKDDELSNSTCSSFLVLAFFPPIIYYYWFESYVSGSSIQCKTSELASASKLSSNCVKMYINIKLFRERERDI